MKAGLPWILLGVAIAVILYLVFRPVPIVNNKEEIKKLESMGADNALLRKSLLAEFFNFSHYKDSTTHVIDSLSGKNIDLKSILNVTEGQKRDLASQILNAKPGEKIDSPCVELARKVINDSLTIGDYQHNTDRLIFAFGDAISHRDSLISRQQTAILSDSILIIRQSNLYHLQENQLRKSQRQAKTSAWLGRSLAVVSLILGGILLAK